jgi:hypothetical protein
MSPKEEEDQEQPVTGTKENPKKLLAASSTSFYTDEKARDHYESLHEVLESKCSEVKLRECILDLFGVCAEITEALRASLVHVEGSTNDFGDTQLSVDVSFSVHTGEHGT